MVVTDDEVSALRALLRGEGEAFDRIISRVQREGEGHGFSWLLVAAFRDAVDRRFGAERKVTDIIQFVATTRTRFGDDGMAINPNAAERLIRAALGDGSAAHLSEQDKGAQIFMLMELAHDDGMDDRELDIFLAKARARAERGIQ